MRDQSRIPFLVGAGNQGGGGATKPPRARPWVGMSLLEVLPHQLQSILWGRVKAVLNFSARMTISVLSGGRVHPQLVKVHQLR